MYSQSPQSSSSIAEAPRQAAMLSGYADQPGCESIEMMGLFKNDTGVANLVEWLAQIRSNGAVTRIVTFSWTDQYGQTQTAQAQIQGGQISSIRLDLTQRMFIPPVSNLQLVSCQ